MKSDIRLCITLRLIILTSVILLITWLHYFTDVTHENIYLHSIHYLLYILPILMAAIWYGLVGGVATALLASALYAPLVFGRGTSHVLEASAAQRVLELLVYNVVGWVTGLLSERERREREHYRHTAEELQKAYTKLREQTDLIIDKEEQLRRAERLSTLGELSAGVAHEIRNPIASIKGAAEILQDPHTPSERRQEFMDLMLKEANRLNRVVANFLELARFRRLQREKANVNDILWRMLQILDLQLGRKNITVHTHFAPELPNVSLDVSQMEQAVLNVFLNAVAAMPAGGSLDLATTLIQENGERKVLVKISDTGTGIAPEHLAAVFDPFFTTKSDGTGLGLPIVKRILQAHGGSVEISSEYGKGTRVTLALPLNSEKDNDQDTSG
jgi:signal transduction histidine kinase